MDEALAQGAPLVWPGGAPGETGEAAAHGADVGDGDEEEQEPSNVVGQSHYERGDIAAGFAQSDVIVERTFTTPMVHQSYLETMSILVQPDPAGEGATVWTSTQAPFYVREQVADVLGVEETAVRVIGTTPGGAFGAKFLLYELLVALAARKVNRPVRLVLTRSEDMVAANPAPSARFRVKLGARRDGTLAALEADITFDTGCYASAHGIAAVMLGSYYQVPHLDINYTEVTTFKLSTGAYRAPGTPQATFALESVMDELAQTIGMDPLELRMKNASAPGDPMVHDRPWSDMGMRQVLETLQQHPAHSHFSCAIPEDPCQ
jgi:CO/xanthine dehydrogenase Mo-binding subunit